MHKKSGQSLIELLIAIGLTAILLPALLTAIVASSEGKAQSQQRTEATNLQKEAEEALRTIREANWQQINTNGTYHPVVSEPIWTLAPGPEDINGYTRKIEIQDAQRDTNGNIASSGTVDPSTKKITTTVSWTTPINSQVDSTAYFSRYLSNSNIQETSQAQFAVGTHTNTQAVNNAGGEVELTQSPSSTSDYGNKFQVLAKSSVGRMTTLGHKTSMRFTAQETKTVTAVRVYLSESQNSRSYRYSLQSDSAGLPSGVFLGARIFPTNSTGWNTVSLGTAVNVKAGTVYHLVVEPFGTPASNRYINVASTSIPNYLIVKTQTADPSSNTLFKAGASASWSQMNQQPIYELDYADSTYEGNPFYASAVSTISGSTWIGEKFTVTGGDKTATAITFLASRNSAGLPLDNLWTELRDAATNTKIVECILPVTNTSYFYETCTFSTPQVLTDGHAYRIVLKSPLSTTANGYLVYRGVGQNSANYNSITYDGTNSIYTASGNSGSTWTDSTNTNQNLDIAGYYFTVTTSGGYATSGSFQSQTKDAGSTVAFNNIKWLATTPAGTALQFQVATSPNPTGPWDFFGADGVIGSYFTAPGPIPLNRINGRYLRYNVLFTSDGASTPTLSEINFNYSP